MDFAISQELENYYAELERFIEAEIDPLVAADVPKYPALAVAQRKWIGEN